MTSFPTRVTGAACPAVKMRAGGVLYAVNDHEI
jgi:hypothetical protein